jgi:hypothetical protein
VGRISPDRGRASGSVPGDMRAWGARAAVGVGVAPTGTFRTGATVVIWPDCRFERECCVASLEQRRAGVAFSSHDALGPRPLQLLAGQSSFEGKTERRRLLAERCGWIGGGLGWGLCGWLVLVRVLAAGRAVVGDSVCCAGASIVRRTLNRGFCCVQPVRGPSPTSCFAGRFLGGGPVL